MSCTVIVIFQSRRGRARALCEWLSAKHSALAAHPGFEDISIYSDGDHPDRVVEIEHWREAADHRRMVDAVDAAGGWDALGELTAEEPTTMYLEPFAR